MSKKILYVIAPKDFRDEEYFIPEDYLKNQANCTVETYSTKAGMAIGMFGGEVEISQTLDTAEEKNYDALVIAGGMGSPEHLWGNEKLRTLIQEFNAAGKLVSAICISGVVLAKADILGNKKATVWKCDDSLKAYQEANVTFTDEPLTIDGNIITANGPEASEDFAKAIAEKLVANPV